MKSNSIYLASTPRHLYQALALAIHHGESQKAFLIISTLNLPDSIIDVFKSHEGSPFESVTVIDQGIPGSFGRFKQFSQIKKQIVSLINETRPANCYVGNDKKPMSQWLLYQAKQANDNCLCWYVDEGVASYFYKKSLLGSLLHRAEGGLKRLIYGGWFKMPSALGTSKYIDNALFSYPEYRHNLYEGIECSKLEVKLFSHRVFLSIAHKVIQLSEFDSSKLNVIDIVFLIPYRSHVEEVYGEISVLRNLILDVQKSGMNVALKYHPKDFNGIGALEKDLKDVIALPPKLPAEILFSSLNKNVVVVGDISSAVLSARWLLPMGTIFSVADRKSTNIDQMKALMKQVGIPIFDTVQLRQELKNINIAVI